MPALSQKFIQLSLAASLGMGGHALAATTPLSSHVMHASVPQPQPLPKDWTADQDVRCMVTMGGLRTAWSQKSQINLASLAQGAAADYSSVPRHHLETVSRAHDYFKDRVKDRYGMTGLINAGLQAPPQDRFIPVIDFVRECAGVYVRRAP